MLNRAVDSQLFFCFLVYLYDCIEVPNKLLYSDCIFLTILRLLNLRLVRLFVW